MNIVKNQAYGSHSRQVADVYYPRNPSKTVVIFWHGGSWQRGGKRTYQFMGRALARLGYLAIVPNYRLYPEVAWPSFAEDAARVVAWVRHEYQPDKLVLMGHSAGGQIAASIAFDPSYLAEAGTKVGAGGPASGFIGLAGAYSFTPAQALKPILETGTRPWQTPELVTGQPVPSLLVHGGSDKVIKVSASIRLGELLRANGGQADTIIYPRLNHYTLLLPFLLGWWILPSLKRRLAGFIDSL